MTSRHRPTPSNITPAIGLRFGKLTVVERVRGFWRCLCDCGATRLVSSTNLKNGNYKSCGCERRARAATLNYQHGLSKTGTWNAWQAMIKRCNISTTLDHEYYGGRGITVCERWRRFENFLLDMGQRPDGMTIERIDVNGNYEPSNCKWIPSNQQSDNTRRSFRITIDGAVRPLAVVCRERGLNRRRVYQRIAVLGWEVERAITEPARRQRRNEDEAPYRGPRFGSAGANSAGRS